MRTNTAVQLERNTGRGMVQVTVPDPFGFEDRELEATERLTVDIPKSDADFLERFAAYRNALAAASERTLKKKWTRKSVAEAALAAQTLGMRQVLKEMFAELGDLPPVDDEAGMARYADRSLKWEQKHSK